VKVSPNPYQPPASKTEVQLTPCFVDGVPVHAHCLKRSWFGRTIQLTGGIDARVRYQAAGSGERVFVNDMHVASSSPWHLTVVAPKIDFLIACRGNSLPATITVYAAWFQLLRVVSFSLSVNGTVVYKEPTGE